MFSYVIHIDGLVGGRGSTLEEVVQQQNDVLEGVPKNACAQINQWAGCRIILRKVISRTVLVIVVRSKNREKRRKF